MKATFLPHFLCVAAIAVNLAARPAAAAERVLFDGQPPAPAGITLGGWGSGSATYTGEEQYEGGGVLRIKVRDFYQGARLDFREPIDLTPVLRQANAYLSLTVKLGGSAQAAPAVAPDMGMLAPGMDPGAMPGMAAPQAPVAKVTKLRIVLQGETGSFELYPMHDIEPTDTGWVTVGIPLESLKERIGEGTFRVKRLVLTANAPDTLSVARIQAINDDTEITADATPSQFNEIPVGQPVRFTAEARAGVTPLKLCWDFDASDGVQEEAVGASVEHTFSKPGRYTVTFTAKPADQADKQPRVTTMEIQVVD
ncbi:MAG TPA: PKD domain-containing protein [Armatimonadota bacterium]|jgi:plastocyanin|nr:PKD domain-containing protein [Armatimonadota bacterium]HOJ20154.1 PKD domain-containing protein [Armatimonadota bacterium]HOM82725.1 PKD domain-containing protein [Armatimonadota bacterium]HOQ27557.1 PKD domain-containing protein [Armatimonadota bacterium]HPO73467.1 PKD domain-containing protein [Armatimonadota bacterium]